MEKKFKYNRMSVDPDLLAESVGIKNTRKYKRERVDPDFVANVLGAKSTGIKVEIGQEPVNLLPIIKILKKDLRSTGGRPGLNEITDRKKVPIYKNDWIKLEMMAKDMKEINGFSVTAAQIASVILHSVLPKISFNEISQASKKQ